MSWKSPNTVSSTLTSSNVCTVSFVKTHCWLDCVVKVEFHSCFSRSYNLSFGFVLRASGITGILCIQHIKNFLPPTGRLSDSIQEAGGHTKDDASHCGPSLCVPRWTANLLALLSRPHPRFCMRKDNALNQSPPVDIFRENSTGPLRPWGGELRWALSLLNGQGGIYIRRGKLMEPMINNLEVTRSSLGHQSKIEK